MTSHDQPWTITYTIPRGWGDPSFDPLDSDSVANAAHMEQLIGTLVRIGSNGNHEPYLASNWSESEGSKYWTFRIAPGRSCSDGTLIDAVAFVESFRTVLRLYSLSSEPPVFNQLVGWSNFLDGDDSAIGIRATDRDEIAFEFAHEPRAGFLQMLSMPYFGFWCRANFEKGKWKQGSSIVSSGAYELKELRDDKTIVMTKRTTLRNGDGGPTTVEVRRVSKLEAISAPACRTINHIVLTGDEKVPAEWQRLVGAPTNLIGLAFGIRENSPFGDARVRRFIQQRVLASLPQSIVGSYSPAGSFYFDSTTPGNSSVANEPLPRVPFEGVLKILSGPQKDKSPIVERIERMLIPVLNELGIPYEIVGLDPSAPDYMKRYTSNEEWHLRLFSVDVGTYPKNWVVRFMFCSNLGINLPDPSERILELVDGYDQRAFPQVEYAQRFESILREEAFVIPLFHVRQTWLYSGDLDLSRVSTAVDIPAFELVGLKG